MNVTNIQRNFVKLTTELRFDTLIDFLYMANILTIYDYESLQSKSRIKKNQEFLRNLEMYGEKATEEFDTYLRKTYPSHYILLHINCKDSCGKSEDRLNVDSAQFQKKYTLLVHRLNVDAVAPFLFEMGLLNSDELESLTVAPTRMEKSRKLLNLISPRLRRSDPMHIFLLAVRTYQTDLFNQLT